MNRQSNTYTLLYSVILVGVVGVVLSLVYQAMRPKQEENIANDTKRQILAAALIPVKDGENVADLYARYIKASYLVNAEGEILADSKLNPFDVNVAEEVKKPVDKRILPVFVCSTSQGDKYIVPVYGAGLWGPIWGYVAMDDNGQTIYGAYFAHQGETPGLGAEIEKPAFSDQFKGKDIFSVNDEFASVAVVKRGQEPAEGAWVHAISGGTITSQGVQKMLYNSLLPYEKYFLSLKNDSN